MRKLFWGHPSPTLCKATQPACGALGFGFHPAKGCVLYSASSEMISKCSSRAAPCFLPRVLLIYHLPCGFYEILASFGISDFISVKSSFSNFTNKNWFFSLLKKFLFGSRFLDDVLALPWRQSSFLYNKSRGIRVPKSSPRYTYFMHQTKSQSRSPPTS